MPAYRIKRATSKRVTYATPTSRTIITASKMAIVQREARERSEEMLRGKFYYKMLYNTNLTPSRIEQSYTASPRRAPAG